VKKIIPLNQIFVAKSRSALFGILYPAEKNVIVRRIENGKSISVCHVKEERYTRKIASLVKIL
jgi:hypothetical protein